MVLWAAGAVLLSACGGEDLVVGGNLAAPPIPVQTPTPDNGD